MDLKTSAGLKRLRGFVDRRVQHMSKNNAVKFKMLMNGLEKRIKVTSDREATLSAKK